VNAGEAPVNPSRVWLPEAGETEFAAGSWGDGNGRQLAADRFVCEEGPLAGKGASRFTSREQIAQLLEPWRVEEINMITRTVDSQRHLISEWIIEASRT